MIYKYQQCENKKVYKFKQAGGEYDNKTFKWHKRNNSSRLGMGRIRIGLIQVKV